ncbi:hypothetical protein BGZ76_000311 [Entomortierella beljakovae]|nr:hypothetical protein BGZ76_000311 [Entomortierella beljakovae]
MSSSNYSESQLVNIKQQFNALDTDGDGYLNEREFNAALQNAHRKPEEYDIQKFFSSADKDKDGKITFGEFQQACWNLGLGKDDPLSGQPSEKTTAQVDEIFRNFDRDGDGSITKDEILATLKSQGDKPTDEDVQQMLDAGDKNNDNKISREEFSKLV